MKQVLFFLESLAGGGAEKVLSDIVGNLNPEEYKVTVCTVTDGDIYQDKVSCSCVYKSFLKIRNYNAGGVKKLIFWLKIKMIYNFPTRWIYKWFIRGEYDIEIAFIEGYATKFIAASSNSRSRKIAWVHTDMLSNAYADKCYLNHKQHCMTYKKYDKILCVSNSVMQAFKKKFFGSSRLAVQYNPVDEKAILENSISEPDFLPYFSDGILLGTIGRLEQPKGYQRLVKCAKILFDKGYKFTIWIIGQGSEKEKIEQYIRENGLDNIVILFGFKKNPYQYLRYCDAFICSSYSEGFSTAATESLVMGKPIFTVDCSGMRELIGDSGCGVIVPNNDDALLELLEDLVCGRIPLEKYVKAAKRRGKAFNLQTRISEIERLFSDL